MVGGWLMPGSIVKINTPTIIHLQTMIYWFYKYLSKEAYCA